MSGIQGARNKDTLIKLVVSAVVMFGFGYALVPFYQKLCAVLEVDNLVGRSAMSANSQVDRSRTVTVEFDANLHQLPWKFKPLQSAVKVHPGEMVQVEYEVTNDKGHEITGQAIPSYGPPVAAQYFRKLECFCFNKQTLEAGMSRRMPIVFVVDPALPKDVTTITLSYTFFEVPGRQAASATQAGGMAASSGAL